MARVASATPTRLPSRATVGDARHASSAVRAARRPSVSPARSAREAENFRSAVPGAHRGGKPRARRRPRADRTGSAARLVRSALEPRRGAGSPRHPRAAGEAERGLRRLERRAALLAEAAPPRAGRARGTVEHAGGAATGGIGAAAVGAGGAGGAYGAPGPPPAGRRRRPSARSVAGRGSRRARARCSRGPSWDVAVAAIAPVVAPRVLHDEVVAHAPDAEHRVVAVPPARALGRARTTPSRPTSENIGPVVIEICTGSRPTGPSSRRRGRSAARAREPEILAPRRPSGPIDARGIASSLPHRRARVPRSASSARLPGARRALAALVRPRSRGRRPGAAGTAA